MSGGVLVGGEPAALLGASSALYEVACRTDDVGRRLAQALGPAATTIAATLPYAPLRAGVVASAVAAVTADPAAGLATVFAAYEGLSLQLRSAGQALEAAGAVGLLATGGLGLLRGQRPTVLASADGVDLRRESFTGSWSLGPGGSTSSLGVREVRRPDGSTFFVVEMTTGGRYAESAGLQVNGFGAFVEGSTGEETTLRWAVPSRRDAELLVAMVSASLVPVAGRLALSGLPRPTEVMLAGTASATVVGLPGAVPGATSASATAIARGEVTALASGGQRFSSSISGGGQAALTGVAGTGGSASARVTVERNPAGAVTKASLTATTEVDRGRHGLPPLEAGNREATAVEREWAVELTPDRRAAADRIATALARGAVPDRADLDLLAGAVGEVEPAVHTYDVRHQQASVDVALRAVDAGGTAAIDTAVHRDGPPGGASAAPPPPGSPPRSSGSPG